MTETKSARSAGEGTWVLPLLALAPAAAVRYLTEPSTPGLAISWVFCALSAIFLAAGWVTVFRHGMRGPSAWVTCVLAHAVLAVQVMWLVRN
ncbi:hypothetical protein ACIGFK_36380 [Streptomyces sp. NPDC085524]|uniref:hypothetical protein n=1 Tax=unclassified Streptomyces TaxID=2593676 RepID=UPI0035D6B5F8